MAGPVQIALDAERAVRQVGPGDVDELYALQLANREHLVPWMPWAEQLDREQAAAFVSQAEEQAARDDGVHCAIVDAGRIVGVIGCHYVNRIHRATSMGFWLAADAQGRGTMTLALAALVDHAFGAWGLHRVEMRAAVDNARSRAVAMRLGFVCEGTLREAERFATRYVDLDVFSVLEPEWRVRRADRTAAPGR